MSVPFDRLMSMGSFDALRALREQELLHPGSAHDELVRLALVASGDAAGLDFDAARGLAEHVANKVGPDRPVEFYRACILGIVQLTDIVWAKAVTRGRDHLVRQLGRDELHCFRAADLLDDEPEASRVEWWDELATRTRASTGAFFLEQGRRAERLSFEREKRRLLDLGISEPPRWVALRDNTAGYDIHSFDLSAGAEVARLVEVKSTIASPARFHITRHEWNQAESIPDAYVFHVWVMSDPPQLYEIATPVVRAHIPTDSGNGSWKQVEVPLSAVLHSGKKSATT